MMQGPCGAVGAGEADRQAQQEGCAPLRPLADVLTDRSLSWLPPTVGRAEKARHQQGILTPWLLHVPVSILRLSPSAMPSSFN